MTVVSRSRYTYADTVARLTKSIADAGNTIFATIDQAAAARGAGLALQPTMLLVFGNPKAGTPLMDGYPLAALDLPLKLLIWEEDAVVHVAYVPASEVVARNSITGKDALIAAMDSALKGLATSIA
jgi:uncharacterized protein (DUF302 family)